MTTTKTYDYDDVMAAIAAAVTAHPLRINPTEEYCGGCVYTSTDDPDHHCIAGQALVDLGLPIPDAVSSWNEESINNVIADDPVLAASFTEDAVDLLCLAQDTFDNTAGSPLRWTEGLNNLLARLTQDQDT